MIDFEFGPKDLSVPVGTTVTWVNNGTKKHSATADDGSFDTGLFTPGQSKSVTFSKPGKFAYYCQLHGDKGGVAMSGVVTVTDK
jgi:plastocyanin